MTTSSKRRRRGRRAATAARPPAHPSPADPQDDITIEFLLPPAPEAEEQVEAAGPPEVAQPPRLLGCGYDPEVVAAVDVPTPGREVRRRWRPSVETVRVACLTLLVLLVHAWNITGFPAATDDEGTYLAQAWAVRNGLGLAHYTYWYDHPPLAWIQLAAVSWLPALFAPDGPAVPVGRVSMLLVTAAIVVLLHLLARRLGLPRWAAAAAVLAYGLSPLVVTTQRQIYLDSFAVAWLLAALVLALSPRRHLWHHIAAGCAAAAAVLCKETVAVALPAVVLALWQNTARGGVRAFSFAGFGCGLVLTGGLFPLYALLNGELLPGSDHVSLIGAWQFQLQNRTGSGSVFTDGSAARAVLGSWLYYDPALLAGGALAVLAALAVRRLRVPAAAVLLLAVVALRPNGYLPTMYVIQALPFLALCAAGVAAVFAEHAGRGPDGARAPRWRRAVLAGLAVLAVGAVGPGWLAGARTAFTTRANDQYALAARWMRDRVADRAGTRVVVDDVLWLDLVRSGFPRENVLWFYKIDLDRTVAARLPNGWRDVDYVISTPAMRADQARLPTVDALLTNTGLVATFGWGDDRIEIRRVPGTPRPGPGRP